METIKIDTEKIKIILDAEDMRKYNLRSDFTLSKETGRQIVNTVLHDAFEKSGFSADGGVLYIQIFPSKEGGCELFITKKKPCDAEDEEAWISGGNVREEETMNPEFDFESRENVIPYCRPRGAVCAVGRRSSGVYIYRFDNMENILQTCREVSLCDSKAPSRLYAGDGEYYLAFDTDTPQAAEFGGVKCPASSAPYISEHCRLICSNAVSTLCSLAI